MIQVHQLLEKDIINLHNQLVANLKKNLVTAIQIGELLCRVKSTLEHGHFGVWITDKMPFSDRTARNYVRLYKNKEQLKTENISDLSSAYKLLAEPKEPQDLGDTWEEIKEGVKEYKEWFDANINELSLKQLNQVISEITVVETSLIEYRLKISREADKLFQELFLGKGLR